MAARSKISRMKSQTEDLLLEQEKEAVDAAIEVYKTAIKDKKKKLSDKDFTQALELVFDNASNASLEKLKITEEDTEKRRVLANKIALTASHIFKNEYYNKKTRKVLSLGCSLS